MRIKKLFVLLFSILTLSLCQCTANPNKGNNNGENGNDNPPIDQPDDGNGGGYLTRLQMKVISMIM